VSRTATSFVLGYHGCSEEVGRKAVVDGVPLRQSDEDFDWLGPGTYFWEGDPRRALEWAEQKAVRKRIDKPFVIGAVIDLGNCFDLLQRDNIELLRVVHRNFTTLREKAGLPTPVNKDPKPINKGDKLLRFLDCAVIRHVHTMIADAAINPPGPEHFEPFDTVRGLFVEGKRAYKGGGFFEKTHTQIAVRTEACIKGVFIPRNLA